GPPVVLDRRCRRAQRAPFFVTFKPHMSPRSTTAYLGLRSGISTTVGTNSQHYLSPRRVVSRVGTAPRDAPTSRFTPAPHSVLILVTGSADRHIFFVFLPLVPPYRRAQRVLFASLEAS